MPVASVTRKARSLNTEHGAHLAGANFDDQTFEPWTLHLPGARTSEIFVNNLDLLKSELTGLIGKIVLPPLALQIVCHLNRRGLAYIHNCPALEVIRCYLRVHDWSPPVYFAEGSETTECSETTEGSETTAAFHNKSASATASSRCLSCGRIIGDVSQSGRFIWPPEFSWVLSLMASSGIFSRDAPPREARLSSNDRSSESAPAEGIAVPSSRPIQATASVIHAGSPAMVPSGNLQKTYSPLGNRALRSNRRS